MKKKSTLTESDKEAVTLSKIEENRKKIHDKISRNENIIIDDVTIKMSQNLDKLIVEYMSILGGRISEKGKESKT